MVLGMVLCSLIRVSLVYLLIVFLDRVAVVQRKVTGPNNAPMGASLVDALACDVKTADLVGDA